MVACSSLTFCLAFCFSIVSKRNFSSATAFSEDQFFGIDFVARATSASFASSARFDSSDLVSMEVEFSCGLGSDLGLGSGLGSDLV